MGRWWRWDRNRSIELDVWTTTTTTTTTPAAATITASVDVCRCVASTKLSTTATEILLLTLCAVFERRGSRVVSESRWRRKLVSNTERRGSRVMCEPRWKRKPGSKTERRGGLASALKKRVAWGRSSESKIVNGNCGAPKTDTAGWVELTGQVDCFQGRAWGAVE